MTREEAKSTAKRTFLFLDEDVKSVLFNFIDDLFDDFEEALKESEFHLQLALAQLSDLKSRTCENCKHWSMEHENIGLCRIGIDQCSVKDLYEFTTKPDFGCNKWEGKNEILIN